MSFGPQFADGGMAIVMYNEARMGDFVDATNGKRVFVDLNIQSTFRSLGM
jgi:hypothetical protein